MPEIRYNPGLPDSALLQPLARVYLIIGADDALKREAAARIADSGLDPSFADFDRETLDFGAGGNAGDEGDDPALRILAAAGAAPFGSPRKVVTATSIQRLSRDRQEALAEGLSHLGERTLLILIADSPEFEAGRPKGRQIEAALKKAAAAAGAVVACEPLAANDLKARARAIFARSGKTAEEAAIQAVVARASSASSAGAGAGDLETLMREAEKLVTYVGERETITAADAELLIAQTPDETIFPLLDAVGARNIKRALELADSLLESGEKPEGIVARALVMLMRHMRILSLAKYLSEHRIAPRAALPADVKDMLSGELVGITSGQAYRLPAYARQAAGFTWEELRRGMQRILAADLAMKGIRPARVLACGLPASDDPAAILRLLVLALCRRDPAGA